jgi:hypothetical protein
MLALAAIGFTAAAAGCAHEGQSIEEAARASCEERHIAPGPDMDACMAEARDIIRMARERENAPVRPERRPPAQPH